MGKKYTKEELQASWQRYLLFKAILHQVKDTFKEPNQFFRIYSDSFKKNGYRLKTVSITGFTSAGYRFMKQFADRYSGRFNFSVPLENPVANQKLLKTVKIPYDIEEKIKIFQVESKLDKEGR